MSCLFRKRLPEEIVYFFRRALTSGKSGVCGRVSDLLPISHFSFTATAAHAVDAKLTAGDTSYDHEARTIANYYNTSKADDIFGPFAYTTKEQATKDIIGNFKEKGWIS